jgi:ABC-2 type transport system ATP-binding protein
MKQKLSLCCALIHEPEILFLDEPTFGVDPISRRDLWLIVHEMVSGGVTVIVSTAYLDEAERCDRVVMLHEGRSVTTDTPARLQERLEGRVLALHTSEPRAARDWLRRCPLVRSAVLFGETIHVTLTDDQDGWKEARAEFEAAGFDLREERIVEPSLEDVFINLVERERAVNG